MTKNQSEPAGSREHILVAAGIILNARHQVLLALRPVHKHQGGLWEFPGGKVEAGESSQEALGRELREELDLTVLEASPFIRIDHDYGDKLVTLDVWLVTAHCGTPDGQEGQEIIWVNISELQEYSFPAANEPIVTALLEQMV